MELEMGQGPEVARRVGHRLWMCAAWRYTGYGHLTLTLTPTLTLTLTPTLTLTLSLTLTLTRCVLWRGEGRTGSLWGCCCSRLVSVVGVVGVGTVGLRTVGVRTVGRAIVRLWACCCCRTSPSF